MVLINYELIILTIKYGVDCAFDSEKRAIEIFPIEVDIEFHMIIGKPLMMKLIS